MKRIIPLLIAAAAVLSAQGAPVTALTFSPDGTALISNGDRHLDIRSPEDASIQRQLACDLPKITALSFAPSGRVLAVGGGEPDVGGEVRLLAWPEGKELRRITGHTDLVTDVAFDVEGKRLAIAGSDHIARVWQIPENGAPTIACTLTGHAGPVLAIAFSPSGQSIVTASADRSLKAWSSTDGRLLRTLSQHTEAIHALAVRPGTAGAGTPATCASGGDDGTVRIWQPEIGRMVRIIRQHEAPILALAWSADGTALFSASKDGTIRRIDADSDTIQAEWRAHDEWIYALTVSPNGSTLASGDWAGRVRLHDTSPANTLRLPNAKRSQDERFLPRE